MSDHTIFQEDQAILLENPKCNHFRSFVDLDNALGPIEWLWANWLPKGFLTVLAGESGAGKSYFALRIALSITNGLMFPDETVPQQSGLVVWCETEASQSLNLDRAKKWGLAIEKIILPLDDATEDISLDNPIHQKRIVEAASLPGVKLVIVDSLSGSSQRDENSTKMIGPTKFLAQLARDKNIAILLIHHLRKRGKMDTNSVDLERVRGSTGIVQTARVVWAMDIPTISGGYKRLRGIKCNLGKLAPPIGYMIDASGIRFDPSPFPEPTEKTSAKEDAVEFLRRMLSTGPCDAQTILAEAEKNGICKRTLNLAKSLLDIRSEREGGLKGKWVWYMD
jgi:putative DNA primase/helicase